MALRIQKKWSQIPAPSAPAAEINAPFGTIVGLSEAHLREIENFGGEATLVLEALESTGFTARWGIVEIKKDTQSA